MAGTTKWTATPRGACPKPPRTETHRHGDRQGPRCGKRSMRPFSGARFVSSTQGGPRVGVRSNRNRPRPTHARRPCPFMLPSKILFHYFFHCSIFAFFSGLHDGLIMIRSPISGDVEGSEKRRRLGVAPISRAFRFNSTCSLRLFTPFWTGNAPKATHKSSKKKKNSFHADC